MVEFLKRNAKATTMTLVVLMVVVAFGGAVSGDSFARVAGLVAFMLILWPVLFIVMIPITLLGKVNAKAAAFGASLGRQAVNAPRKSAAQAIQDAADEAMSPKANATAPARTPVPERVAAPPVPTPPKSSAPDAPKGASDEGTPAEAMRMAEQFVALTDRKFGFRLDYSPATLDTVDQLVDKVKSTGVSEQDGSGMIYAIGCYVGEVMVRHGGGEWRPTAELNMQSVCSWPLVVRMPDGTGMNPIGKAFKRFRNGDADSLAYFYRMTLRLPEIVERAGDK
jgi:hypothetical protein